MRTTATIDQIVKEWSANLDVMPATRTDYVRKIGLWFRWLAKNKIDQRSPSHSHLVQYKQSLTAEGRSRTGVASYVAVVRLFYKYCERQRLYYNVGEGIKSSYRKTDYSKKLFEFVTEVILELFLFLFLFCKSDFSELNEDLQGGNRGEKSQKGRD